MRITAPKHVALSSSQHAIQAMSREWTRTFSTMFTCDLVCPAATTRWLADCARADQHLLPGRWSRMEGRGRRIWPGKPSRLYCVPPQPCHSRYRTSYVRFIAPTREHRGLCRVLLGAVSQHATPSDHDMCRHLPVPVSCSSRQRERPRMQVQHIM